MSSWGCISEGFAGHGSAPDPMRDLAVHPRVDPLRIPSADRPRRITRTEFHEPRLGLLTPDNRHALLGPGFPTAMAGARVSQTFGYQSRVERN
jgi:hypothetical protein